MTLAPIVVPSPAAARGETPATLSLYQLAAHELDGVGSVLDGGCGSGAGTELLTRGISRVIAVDHDPAAVATTRRRAPKAEVRGADLAALTDAAPVDAAVLIDVLGYARFPELVLLSLRSVLGFPPGSAGAPGAHSAPRLLFLAERAAHPSQFLAPPLRRAFTPPAVRRMLAATGYEVQKWLHVDGSFFACLAAPFCEPAWENLTQAQAAFAAGQVEETQKFFEEAEREGGRPDIRLEAAVGLANLSLMRRNADGAVAACFRARELSPEDVRPAAVLARIALAVGESAEAERLAALASRLDPGDVEGAYANATVATQAQRGSLKEKWLLASNLAPDSLDAAARLASAAIDEGDADLAVFALERVRAYGDDHGAPLHIAFAWSLLAAGRNADALLEARIANQLSPDDPAVKNLVTSCQTIGA